jgi:hypothetical protein
MSKKLVMILALVVFIGLITAIGISDLKMPGADEKVGAIANQYAKEVGVEEREPYINTDKGDLLLFMFTIGGAAAGFWLGYNCRDLFGKEKVNNFQKSGGEGYVSKL